MKKPDFLSKLKKDGKLESVEPSEEICSSYLKKADDCLKSAKILLKKRPLRKFCLNDILRYV